MNNKDYLVHSSIYLETIKELENVLNILNEPMSKYYNCGDWKQEKINKAKQALAKAIKSGKELDEECRG